MTPLLNIKQAGEVLGASYPKMIRLINEHKIAATKVGGTWMFTEESLQDYIKSRTVKVKKLTPAI